MTQYKIKYFYHTGDSFHTEDCEDILESSWENLEVAKEALKRIKEHYTWYELICDWERYSHIHKKSDKPKPPKWWDVKSPYDAHYCLNLPLDNGKEFQFSAPWCGYFEGLYGAQIFTSMDEELSFSIN